MERARFCKQKTVMVINDFPVKKEFIENDKFSSASNMNLLTSLRTGRIQNYVERQATGVNLVDIFTTYLDYGDVEEREGNFDYSKELAKKSNKDEEYIKLENFKDVYISQRLHKELQELLREIREVQPKLIIVTGKWTLFLLTSCISLVQNQATYKDKKPLGCLNKFRSSLMQIDACHSISHEHILIPIWHPINALAMPDKVRIMELDLQKVGWMYQVILEKGIQYFLKPDTKYIVCKSTYLLDKEIEKGTETEKLFLREEIYENNKLLIHNYLDEVLSLLEIQKLELSIDVETFFHSVIDCLCITYEEDRGISIPFCSKNNPYIWKYEDELAIMLKLYDIFMHRNTLHLGQNYQYDCQCFYYFWGLKILPYDDTMIMHHILYNNLPKNLAFLASLYTDNYTHWKDDLEALEESPETRWLYNIKDGCYTKEIKKNLNLMLQKQPQMKKLYEFQVRELQPTVLKTMYRGIDVDTDRKQQLYTFFSKLVEDVKEDVNRILGYESFINKKGEKEYPFNINSPNQKKKIFSDFLGMEIIVRKGSETCDATAMLEYLEEYPLYKPFLTLLLEYASLKLFTTNFLGMQLESDGKVRTQLNVAGTDTGRLSSTKNIFRRAANMQTLPKRGKIKLKYAKESLNEEEVEEDLLEELSRDGVIELPNVKKIFLPPKGMEIADVDLAGADLQITAAESQCRWLLDFFENPRGNGKAYHYIASDFFQREITDVEYKKYKAVFLAATYLVGDEKIASMVNIKLSMAKKLKDFFFDLCWEIPKNYHEPLKKQVREKGYLDNKFGRRRWFLNKNDPMLMNKAAAYKPSSTIADIVHTAWVKLDREYPEILILLEVHDALVTAYPEEKKELYRPIIVDTMSVPLEYPHGILRIPAEIAVSSVSYGDCKKLE